MMSFVLFLLISLPGRACTGDYYSIPAGTQQDIDECGTCKLITNNGTKAIFVPTKTATEWTNFYTNVTANTGGAVTVGTCATTCTYPLDTIAAPSAAYSLRKIKSAYAGALIRIRRSSDNAEQDISPLGTGCGDLDTAAITTFVGANSAYVKTWYDQSGNARNASQTTAGSQPRIVNAGTIETKYGKTTIYFNGTTFIPGVALGIASTSSWSYSMVVGSVTYANGGANDGAGTYFLDRTSATNNIMSLKAVSNKLCMQKRNDAGSGLGCVSTTTNISATAIQSLFAQRTYNSSFNVFLNNAGEGSLAETLGALTPPNPNIGRHTSGTSTANFGLFEFIIWGSALSSGDRTTVVQDQQSAFGF